MMRKFFCFLSVILGVGFLLLSILCWIPVETSPAYQARWYIFLAGCFFIVLSGMTGESSLDSIEYEIESCERKLRDLIYDAEKYHSGSYLNFLKDVQSEFSRYTNKVKWLYRSEGSFKEPLDILVLIDEVFQEIQLNVIREPGEFRYRLITLKEIINRRIQQIENLHTTSGA